MSHDGAGGLYDQPPISTAPKINDERILNTEVQDNLEELVDIFTLPDSYRKRILLPEDPRLNFHRNDLANTTTPYLRKELVNKIQMILEILPDHIGIVIIEPYRTYEFQKDLYVNKVNELINTGLTYEQAQIEANQFVSDPDLYSPHVTGGALDIGLVDLTPDDENKIRYLDMGNLFEDLNSAAMDFPNLTDIQKNNRQLLKRVMTSAGFVNYPYEWWHWSYGDKYWAWVKNQRAIYDSINPPHFEAVQ